MFKKNQFLLILFLSLSSIILNAGRITKNDMGWVFEEDNEDCKANPNAKCDIARGNRDEWRTGGDCVISKDNLAQKGTMCWYTPHGD